MLWSALKKANGARVINVSSQGHQFAPFNFDDPNFEHREYETLQGYGQSKTAVNLFSLELDNRAKEFGVRAYSLHPGSIAGTELGREALLALFVKMGLCDDKENMLPEVAASQKKFRKVHPHQFGVLQLLYLMTLVACIVKMPTLPNWLLIQKCQMA